MILVLIVLLFAIYKVHKWNIEQNSEPTIIIVTPTHKRPARLADMTRLSQTLMHVKNIHWIVIEDGDQTVDAVERILKRSGIMYGYFYTITKPGYPKTGETQRNAALQYIRKRYNNYEHEGVVYFADDDNTYDIRVFDNYIRKVKDIGIWAVGLAGGAAVEAPHVENGTITKWDVLYSPNRTFAVDMAGFAVNVKLILNSTASFHKDCKRGAPESCFLSQFGISKEDITPFGWDEEPKDVLVWHTMTCYIGNKDDHNNYTVEA